MDAVALISDLIFATKVSSTAGAVGSQIKVVRTIDALVACLDSAIDSVPLAIIDMELAGDDPVEAIRRTASHRSRPRIVAYVSHVRGDLVQAAREAGATDVMARSAFVARLPELLTPVDRSTTAQPEKSTARRVT